MTTEAPPRRSRSAMRYRGWRLVRDNAFPVLVFLVVNVGIIVLKPFLSTSQQASFSYIHGDSGLYISVAGEGYNLFPCTGTFWPPHSWCGNAGWQPLYPWLIKVVTLTGLPDNIAAVAISQVFTVVVFVWLWQLLRGARHRYLVMLTAAVFPGVVYFFTAFPISLLIFLVLLLFTLLDRRQYLWALIPAFFIPLTYSSAVLILPVVGLWWLVWRRLRDWQWGALVLGAAAAGYLTFLAVLQISVNTWKAEFWIQEKYGNGLHNPIATLSSHLTPAPGRYFSLSDVETLQTTFVVGMMVVLAYVVVRNFKVLTNIEQLIACWTLVFWLSPLVVGVNISGYRSNALLLPAVVLLRYVSWPVIVLFVVLAAPIAYLLGVQVLSGALL